MGKRFFGLHFDFHADNEAEIGIRTNEEDIDWYIKEAQPDFIQCDCKGHPGNACYPTKVGKAADNLKADNLKIWCDTAKKNGVPIYVHYSGLCDEEYLKAHPEDAARDVDGNIITPNSCKAVSLFGNYSDKLLISQLKELITDYDIDGVWVDGDCWAAVRDYSDNIKPYLYEGITKEEHDNLIRDAFVKYLKHYTDELHKFKPDFKVISSWAYTAYMPEKQIVNLDYISGDILNNNILFTARYESRCIAGRETEWDLMSWGFEYHTKADKSAVQLCQEAAVILSLGGGYQVYIMQNKDGSVKKTDTSRIREISEFVRAREICHNKKPASQTALLFCCTSYYKHSEIYSSLGASLPLVGAVNCVLDAQYTADIIMEYQIDKICEYDTVIVPEWKEVTDEVRSKLISYAENGGNVLVMGAEAAVIFGRDIGLDFSLEEEKQRFIYEQGIFSPFTSKLADVICGEEKVYDNSDLRDSCKPAYRIKNMGKGKIAFLPYDIGKLYHDGRSFVITELVKKILGKLCRPDVEINRENIDITMQKTEKGFFVNLININQGRHGANVILYNDIPPVHDVEIIINKPCKKVTMPLGENFECEYGEEFVRIKLDKLEIHSVIEIEIQ